MTATTRSSTPPVRSAPDLRRSGSRRSDVRRYLLALAFLAPALVFLGALLVYPSVATAVQSFYSSTTGEFVGLSHYREIAQTPRILTALKNTAIWVAAAPAIVTGLGLMFALLTERVRYGTAIKTLLFMPMAISFLATGVIWRVVYDPEPSFGLANATVGAAYNAAVPPGPYPEAEPAPEGPLTVHESGAVYGPASYVTGEVARLGLVAIPVDAIPDSAEEASLPQPVPSDGVGVVVWRDFQRGGGGTPGEVESGEVALPEATVVAVDRGGRGEVVARTTTSTDGTAVFRSLGGTGPYQVRVAPETFREPFAGINWLGPSLVTYAIIFAFCWMWAGFAVVLVAAGLAALPRDVLEAARIDGAGEWQVFRRVVMPLLSPVLGVVFVTMVINVLKIFDIVLILAPGGSQDAANVIALEMYKTSFTAQQYGLGSAVAVLLFVLVVPFMALNVRRFRRQQ